MSSRIEMELPIDLRELGVEQLLQLKNQIEQELDICQRSFAKLKLVETKLQESMESAEKMMTLGEGRKMWVPLTSSVYVEGELLEPDKLLVDIGGGYFVNINSEDAVEYFKRKLHFVKVEEGKLQEIGCEKSKALPVISEVLELKLQQLTLGDSK